MPFENKTDAPPNNVNEISKLCKNQWIRLNCGVALDYLRKTPIAILAKFGT
jgi:hypothetical protein